MELALGASDAMASCIRFDVTILADMPVAFEGTASAVDGADVTLTVDHWYKGGDATTVTLHGHEGAVALLGGFPFEVGRQYLITATDGNVNFCGYSGEATPDLQSAFDQAFSG